MTGPVKYDSIAKCTPGNDLYAMIRNPTAKISPRATKPVDTVKSLQGQMEREAVARLSKFIQNFIVIARAGKFVFLAFAIPPYILFYGLPKWVLADVLPNLVFNPFKLINKKIKDLFKSNETNKGVVNSLRNAFAAAATKAAEYIKWINSTSKSLFVHLKHHAVALGYRLLKPFIPTFQKSFEAAETVTKILLKKTYEKSDHHIDLARQFVSFAWKVAKQEFINQFRPYVELVKNKFNDFRKQIKKLIEKPRIEIQKFKVAITQRLKRTEEVLKTTTLKISKNTVEITTAAVSYVARPIIEWSTPKIQWAASVYQSGREKMFNQFERIRGFVQNLAAGTMDAARLSRHAVITVVKNVFEAIAPAFVKQFFNPEQGFKKKYQEMIQNLGQKIKKVKNAATQYARDSLQAAKRQFFEFIRKIRDFFYYVGRQIKQLPSRTYALMVKTYRFGVYSFVKTGHFLRWINVWSRVLGRLAWQELRERAAEIISIKKSSEV